MQLQKTMYSLFEKEKSLAPYSTLGIGGPAKYFIDVVSVEMMQEVMAFCSKEKLGYFIIGKGSNCFFDSKGLSCLVIHNKIEFLQELEPGLFSAGAGFSFSRLGTKTAQKGYSGLEFASGIPGSVGGAIFMNAGAQGQSTFDTLESCQFVDATGTLCTYRKEELSYEYRKTSFHTMEGAIVSATFRLKTSEDARKNQIELLGKRTKTQPYSDKSCGCFFKNPLPDSCGKLVDELGLKGFSVGDAKVSDLHANFLINSGSATSDEMIALRDEIKKRVKEAYGIDLVQEVYWIEDRWKKSE